jgi:hypothetical protein
MPTNTVDRSPQVIWFWLAIVGIILMLVGWYRWAF